MSAFDAVAMEHIFAKIFSCAESDDTASRALATLIYRARSDRLSIAALLLPHFARLVSLCDANHAACVPAQLRMEGDVAQACSVFDADGSGGIDKHELSHALKVVCLT